MDNKIATVYINIRGVQIQTEPKNQTEVSSIFSIRLVQCLVISVKYVWLQRFNRFSFWLGKFSTELTEVENAYLKRCNFIDYTSLFLKEF